MFPSPIGELHFSIINKKEGDESPLYRVSVPYRGATFLNHILNNVPLCAIIEYVSVPYRGATFLNSGRRYKRKETWVSVPYRGATFLNTISANPPPVWCKYGNCVAKIIFAKCSCFWKYKSLQESVFKPCVAKS